MRKQSIRIVTLVLLGMGAICLSGGAAWAMAPEVVRWCRLAVIAYSRDAGAVRDAKIRLMADEKAAWSVRSQAAFDILIDFKARPAERLQAHNLIVSAGRDLVPQLRIALRNDAPAVRSLVIFTLQRLHANAAGITGEILEAAAKDADPDVCRTARNALVVLDPALPALRPLLLAGIDERQVEASLEALEGLIRLNPPCVGDVCEILRTHRSPGIRRQAAQALAQCPLDDPRIKMALLHALADAEPSVAQAAKQKLERLGAAVAAELTSVLDPSRPLAERRLAADLLEQGAETMNPKLRAIWRDSITGAEVGLRWKTLFRARLYSQDEINRLRELLRSEAADERFAAAVALAERDPTDGDAARVLCQSLDSPNDSLKALALETLAGMGEHAREAAPLLRKLAAAPQAPLAIRAKIALLAIAGEDFHGPDRSG